MSQYSVLSNSDARARDKIRCITKMLAAMVYLRNMPLMGPLFPLVWVGFEEIYRESIDEVPVPLVNTSIKNK